MSDCFVPRVTVVIPTYRRPAHLERCLAGLSKQSLAPAETIVMRRAGDDATTVVISESPHAVGEVVVAEPGVLTAMEAGVAAASSDVVAFIDDDAVPRADWLERLGRHFQDPEVGGVGGRDIIVTTMSEAMTDDVGRLTRWGKVIGNHHRGAGRPRDVMVLKAAGMAFRKKALSLPRGLRGAGAQAHFEVETSLSALRRGWRLIYRSSTVARCARS